MLSRYSLSGERIKPKNTGVVRRIRGDKHLTKIFTNERRSFLNEKARYTRAFRASKQVRAVPGGKRDRD